jgi:hypothetical protein
MIFSLEIGIISKLVRPTKMHLHEAYSKFYIGINLSDAFHIQNGLKQGNTSSRLPS